MLIDAFPGAKAPFNITRVMSTHQVMLIILHIAGLSVFQVHARMAQCLNQKLSLDPDL